MSIKIQYPFNIYKTCNACNKLGLQSVPINAKRKMKKINVFMSLYEAPFPVLNLY